MAEPHTAASLSLGFVLLQLEAVNASPTDLFEGDIGERALHVVIAHPKDVAADLKDVVGLEDRVLYVSGDPLDTLLPGCTASKHFTSLSAVPPSISSERAIASVCCGLRALGALNYKVPPACVRGATVLIVCAGDEFASACVTFAIRFGAKKILLHTSTADEYKRVASVAPHDLTACSVVVLPPVEDVVRSTMSHTGGMGVDILLDMSSIAEVLGRPWSAARESVRWGSDAGIPVMAGAVAIPLAEDSVAEGSQYIPSLEALVQCLSVCSHLATVRHPSEIDAPLLERLKLKNASLHCCQDMAWVATPRHAGKLLHMIDECIQCGLRSELGTRPPQMVLAADNDLPSVLRSVLGKQLGALTRSKGETDNFVVVHQ